ncbi:CHY zinc finger protein [Natrialbaceae archaeon A-CW2]|uniref:CHY zinc finger protein n=1 Tax=Natronosalvus amylolyticus TaxID=2961994 RepID=UPI0020C9EF64|nr:CHY zinc finger protein [Natronosalvus amylolyticus]
MPPSSNVTVRGLEVDDETRCAHYASERDVVALRFGCCEAFYPCFQCHDAVADHDPEPWPLERFDEPAVYCGACDSTVTASAYLEAENVCPECDAEFNPGCRDHYDRYFERPPGGFDALTGPDADIDC